MNINENFNYQKLPEIEDKLSKIISLGQNKVPELKTLKESNINKFKENFILQVKYINKIKQEKLSKELENVIHLLDDFFQRDFNKRKKDLNVIKNLKREKIQIKNELDIFIEKHKEFIGIIKKKFKSEIKESLLANKKELKNKLFSEKYVKILEEINNQIKINLKGLNNSIEEYIKNNAEKAESILLIRKTLLEQLSLNDREKDKSFYIDICERLGSGKRDLESQLSKELEKSCNSFDILKKKGIKQFFNSLLSDLNYLENVIDILIDTSLKKINYILDLLEEKSNKLLHSYYRGITYLIDIACADFTDEQKKIWKELCAFYKKNRDNLINTKSNIIEILNSKKKE